MHWQSGRRMRRRCVLSVGAACLRHPMSLSSVSAVTWPCISSATMSTRSQMANGSAGLVGKSFTLQPSVYLARPSGAPGRLGMLQNDVMPFPCLLDAPTTPHRREDLAQIVCPMLCLKSLIMVRCRYLATCNCGRPSEGVRLHHLHMMTSDMLQTSPSGTLRHDQGVTACLQTIGSWQAAKPYMSILHIDILASLQAG